VQNFAFKFQALAEKTAKIVRGLLYFAAPCIYYVITPNSVVLGQREWWCSASKNFPHMITMQNLVVVSHTVCAYVMYWSWWKSEASFCAPPGPMRAIYENRIWQTQFPRCCAQNMELFTATSPFANHQPTTVPVWALNSSLQTRLHNDFTSFIHSFIHSYILQANEQTLKEA